MRLSAGTLVHEDCVLQTHPGRCQDCGELTHGILLGGAERLWYSAQFESEHTWRIHLCRTTARSGRRVAPVAPEAA